MFWWQSSRRSFGILCDNTRFTWQWCNLFICGKQLLAMIYHLLVRLLTLLQYWSAKQAILDIKWEVLELTKQSCRHPHGSLGSSASQLSVNDRSIRNFRPPEMGGKETQSNVIIVYQTFSEATSRCYSIKTRFGTVSLLGKYMIINPSRNAKELISSFSVPGKWNKRRSGSVKVNQFIETWWWNFILKIECCEKGVLY